MLSFICRCCRGYQKGVKRPKVFSDTGNEEEKGGIRSENGRGGKGGGERGSQEKLLQYGETSLSLGESTPLIRK